MFLVVKVYGTARINWRDIKDKTCVYKQVRSDVRRHGIGEVSLIVTGGSDARDVGRSEGRGPEGTRQGTRGLTFRLLPPPNFLGRWIRRNPVVSSRIRDL